MSYSPVYERSSIEEKRVVPWLYFIVATPEGSLTPSDDTCEHLGSRLFRWREQKEVGRWYLYGVYDIDRFKQSYGGGHGLRLFEEIEHLSSLLALRYAGAVEDILEAPDRSRRAAEITYAILRGSVSHLDRLEVAELLRRWVGALSRSLRKKGLTVELPSISGQVPQYASALARKMSSDVQEPRSWYRDLEEFSTSMVRLSPDIENHFDLIASVLSPHEWVGRRLIHLTFPRFYFDGLQECLLTLALAECIEKEMVAWNR